MDKKQIEAINKALKGKNIDPALKASLEEKKAILLKNKTVKK